MFFDCLTAHLSWTRLKRLYDLHDFFATYVGLASPLNIFPFLKHHTCLNNPHSKLNSNLQNFWLQKPACSCVVLFFLLSLLYNQYKIFYFVNLKVYKHNTFSARGGIRALTSLKDTRFWTVPVYRFQHSGTFSKMVAYYIIYTQTIYF